MEDIKWIYAMLVFLLSEAQSIKSETNQSTVNSNSSSPAHFENKDAAFNLGSEAILTCSNKTWKDMLFVTWDIHVERNIKSCRIAFNGNGQNEDSCDGKTSLQNTSSSQSYLHIPKFSKDDVGVYKCYSVYKGGTNNYEFNVTITVPPRLSSWLDTKDNKMVAVCKAEGGNSAANISWSHSGNVSILEVIDSQGLFTVESRFELPEGMDTENLTCSIRHPSILGGQKTLALKPKKGYGPWLYILTVVVIIVFLAGVLFFAQKTLWRRCKLSESSPSKSPPTEDVEEVEPYASYVQRVNSIYNSSADLFT
ncbi:cell surface glycoprotein CD200 receptor 1 isoform X1 [Trematomus bernacchii]|uniref:cell surface glycoprotein CD200 receptor 1 isoform X1 n=1 Tax=Trematomus bernacchii TaxID=40690 RepID=UPI00146F887F|nr:cell surface glycoprotein CD200 receptor 1 isoform X1 [Trematomus bernacchii]